MKELAACATALLMIAFSLRYAWQVYKKDITPALSMWAIFFAGAFLSLISYAVAEDRDFLSGIQNVVDVAIIIIIIISILLWGKTKRVRFKSFEKNYLVFAVAIVFFWIISKSAFYSNLLTQALMTWAYFPTFQNLIKEKRNTESFSGWILAMSGQLFALYPAFIGGNLLASVYVGRAVIMTGILLCFMTYYHLKNKKNSK